MLGSPPLPQTSSCSGLLVLSQAQRQGQGTVQGETFTGNCSVGSYAGNRTEQLLQLGAAGKAFRVTIPSGPGESSRGFLGGERRKDCSSYKARRHGKAQQPLETASVCYSWSMGGREWGWEMRPGKQPGAKEEQTAPSCQGVCGHLVLSPFIGTFQTGKG